MKTVCMILLLCMVPVVVLAEQKQEKSEAKQLLKNVVYDEITIHAVNGNLVKRVKKSTLASLKVGPLPSGIYQARVEGIPDVYTFLIW